MFLVMGVMIAGILIGYLLRAKRRWLSVVGRLNMQIIYLLLFAMGLSVGNNEKVMQNLGTLGLQGILISTVSIAGSVLLSAIVYRYFFVSPAKKEERDEV